MEIYAEISRELQLKLDSGSKLILPRGVEFKRKVGSRALYIECEEDMLEEVEDIFDNEGISFQSDDIGKNEKATNRGGRH